MARLNRQDRGQRAILPFAALGEGMPPWSQDRRPSIEQVRAGLEATLFGYAESGLVDNVRILAGCCPTCDQHDRAVLPNIRREAQGSSNE
jgi:hypothetical protein